MESLDRDSQLFENGITYETLAIFLVQDMSIVRMGTSRLEYTFAEPLTESTVLISLNQFETYWKVTPDCSVLLDLAP